MKASRTCKHGSASTMNWKMAEHTDTWFLYVHYKETDYDRLLLLYALENQPLSWLSQSLINESGRWGECTRIAFPKARNELQVREAFAAFIRQSPTALGSAECL